MHKKSKSEMSNAIANQQSEMSNAIANQQSEMSNAIANQQSEMSNAIANQQSEMSNAIGSTDKLSSTNGKKQFSTGSLSSAKEKRKFSTRMIAYTGIMTSLVFVATIMGFSTAEFYFNLGDTVILITSAIFGPLPGMIAGGLGSFLADLTVYPATMLFTLFIKGLEGLLAGLLFALVRKIAKSKTVEIGLSVIVASFATLFMMTGYFVCQVFFYGTIVAGIVALPMDACQAACSTALAIILLYPCHLINFRSKLKANNKAQSYKRQNVEAHIDKQ